MGDPDEESRSFITEEMNLEYLNYSLQGRKKIGFRKEFNKTATGITDILQNMLEFNPHFRKSASDLLNNSIFDKVRDPALEQTAPFKISLKIDELDDYDYSKQKFRTLRVSQMKQMLSSEISCFHSK